MRIELTSGQLQISAGQTGQKPLALQPGEVLNATVVSVEGDAVFLKTEDGRLFSARLAEGTALQENDMVELMASPGNGGQERSILRVVFVEPGRNVPMTKETPIARQAIPQEVLTTLSQMNLKPTPKLAAAIADMMKQSVDVKLAAFFAANSIPATAENIRAMQSILSGPSFGAALHEVAQEASSLLLQDGAEPEAPQQAPVSEQVSVKAAFSDKAAAPVPQGTPEAPGSGGTQTGGDIRSLPLQEQEAAQGGIQQAQESLPKEQATPGQQGKPIPQEQPAKSAQGALPAQDMAGKPASAPEAHPVLTEQPTVAQKEPVGPQQPRQAASQAAIIGDRGDGVQQPGPNNARNAMQVGKRPVTGADIPYLEAEEAALHTDKQLQPAKADVSAIAPAAQEGKETAVLKQLLEIFTRADGQMDAQALKKSVEETPQKLFALQKLIKNTDIHTQEALSSRLDELTAQAKLGDDISRFVFIQVPLHLKEYGSAELYIYKRNQRDKGAQRERTSVVLGLSTQNMGRVEAMLRIEKREISLDLRVQNENALILFREHAQELQDALSGMQYQLMEYKVGALIERTTPLNAEETLQRLYQPASAGLDVMI